MRSLFASLRGSPRHRNGQSVTAAEAPDALKQRLKAIDESIADPPQVHVAVESGAAPGGVWYASRDLYELMALHCPPGSRTLETGLGTSTLLFARWGTYHTCLVDKQGEVDRLIEHCDKRRIDTSRLTFLVGPSDVLLQRLNLPRLDLFLIDGCHGFPAALIDWYFGARFLRRGGVLVLDDTSLPSVRLGLLDFLHRDARWKQLTTSDRWESFTRESEGALAEEWSEQRFLEAT